MEILVLVITAILVVIFAILHFKQQEKQKAKAKEQEDRETLETVALIRQGLIEKNDANSNRIDIWREWHSQHEYLGEPTEYVGFSELYGWPWERPKLNLKFDDNKSPSEQMDDALSGGFVQVYDPYVEKDIVPNQWHDLDGFMNSVDMVVIMVE